MLTMLYSKQQIKTHFNRQLLCILMKGWVSEWINVLSDHPICSLILLHPLTPLLSTFFSFHLKAGIKVFWDGRGDLFWVVTLLPSCVIYHNPSAWLICCRKMNPSKCLWSLWCQRLCSSFNVITTHYCSNTIIHSDQCSTSNRRSLTSRSFAYTCSRYF